MYDNPAEERFHQGERYAGQRKPSLVLEAMLPDLLDLYEQLLEDGQGIVESRRPLAEAQAYLALAKSDPDWNTTLREDDEEWDGYGEIESMVMNDVITDLFVLLSEQLTAFHFYGWLSDDPESDDYERLGVWINWPKIDTWIDDGRIFELDDLDDLENPDFRNRVANSAPFALWEPNEDTFELYDTRTGSLVWAL